MPSSATFLVRGPSGQMATVVAHSVRGALKIYLHKYRPGRGEFVSVKQRGEGDWVDFKVT